MYTCNHLLSTYMKKVDSGIGMLDCIINHSVTCHCVSLTPHLLNEGFRGIIFLLYWPEHGCSSLTESSHAVISPRCGFTSTPPTLSSSPSEIKEEGYSGPFSQWLEGGSTILPQGLHLCPIWALFQRVSYWSVLSQFWWSNTKEIYQSLKPVSVHYRNKAWIKHIGVHSF